MKDRQNPYSVDYNPLFKKTLCRHFENQQDPTSTNSMILIEVEFYNNQPDDVRKKYFPVKNQIGRNLYSFSNGAATIVVHVKKTYWTIARVSLHGFKRDDTASSMPPSI